MAIIGSKISSVSTSGEIVGISASEVAQVLGEPLITDSVTGVTGDAVGYLCGSSKIKKWNIHKPIFKSKYSKLEEADYRGESTDIAKGIIYGLQAGIARINPAGLHSADWSYVGRPTTINRLGDFDGYDHSIEAPNLSGTGLEDGQRVNYAATFNVQLIWAAREGAIDLAQVFSTEADYSKMYLCALVGTYGRCCVNNDAGGIYPIIHNNVQCRSFSVPAVSPITSYDTTKQVTLFFASKTDVDNLVPALKTSWVDFSVAPNFNQPLVSVPNQVNKTINFVRQLVQYIASFSITESRGSITMSIGKGDSWDRADAYRVMWAIKDVGGTTYPLSTRQYTALDKSLAFVPITLVSDLMTDANVVTNNRQYSITATMQHQLSGIWSNSTFSSTITVTY